MIVLMDKNHIQEVSEIHLSSWNPNEISVKLGSEFVKDIFYTNIVVSEYSFGYIFLKDDTKEIVGYATGFYDYQKFNKQLNKVKLLFLFLKRVLCRKVGVVDIINIFNEGKKLRKVKFPEYHLGALALANKYKCTHKGYIAINEVMQNVLNEFRSKGLPGCWGACDDKNKSMKSYLIKLGFKLIDEVQFNKRKLAIFEKEFTTE